MHRGRKQSEIDLHGFLDRIPENAAIGSDAKRILSLQPRILGSMLDCSPRSTASIVVTIKLDTVNN